VIGAYGAAARAVTVAAVGEQPVGTRLEHVLDGMLHHLVTDSRQAEDAPLARLAVLGNGHLVHGLRDVRADKQLSVERGEVRGGAPIEFVHRDVVKSPAGALGADAGPCGLEAGRVGDGVDGESGRDHRIPACTPEGRTGAATRQAAVCVGRQGIRR